GSRRELWPFHTDVRASEVHRCVSLTTNLSKYLHEIPTHRISKRHMRHNTTAKKSANPTTGAVDKLIGNHHMPRFNSFSDATNRADGNQVLHPKLFHAVDISTEIQFRRKNTVSTPVPRQEGHTDSVQFTHKISIRRHAKGSIHRHPFPALNLTH